MIIKLPASAFEEIESTISEKTGKVLKQFKLKGTELVGTEVEFELSDIAEIKVQPMIVPTGSIFYLKS